MAEMVHDKEELLVNVMGLIKEEKEDLFIGHSYHKSLMEIGFLKNVKGKKYQLSEMGKMVYNFLKVRKEYFGNK